MTLPAWFTPGPMLRRVDGNYGPGDVVGVQHYTMNMSPENLYLLGITPDMTQDEVTARMTTLLQRAAEYIDDDGNSTIAPEEIERTKEKIRQKIQAYRDGQDKSV